MLDELADRDTRRPDTSGSTATILSVATELPPGRLTSAELAAQLGISEDWIVSRTGIRERRRAEPHERLTDYAIRAGRAALAAARVSPAEVDLVIVATMSSDELTPNTAPLLAAGLGASGAGAFDVGAACTAFLSGLALGAGQIESGRAGVVLLVGADFITRIIDYTDRGTAPLFADAAGAVVLGRSGEHGEGSIGPIVLRSDGSGADLITATHSERRLRMNGPEVYRQAVARMGEVTLEVVQRAGIELEDIDLLVPHQANARITRALGERLGLPTEKVVDCIETFGNTSAATLPVALAVAVADGRLRPGAQVLLSTFGAGLTWGAGIIEWGGPAGDA
ncbi:MAG: beta-ketoacyl-ACP synthase 3 [Solirubrobacteraceae bacterium]